MNLSRLIKDNPEITARFMDISGTSLVILTDVRYRILECNQSLAVILHLNQKPLGRFLGELLCPLEQNEFNVILSQKDNGVLLPQVLQVCYGEALYRCYSFEIQEGFLIFGDRFESADNEVLESMSLLNNELSSLSRELSRKNRELAEANRKITELMRTDPLTGLANRRFLQERLAEVLALARRKHSALAVILADLDHFKTINDNYGHDAGDRVLQKFAALLKENCRTEDLAVRFGGEEFLLLLPQSTAAQALQLAERIRGLLEGADILGNDIRITASMGIAELAFEDTMDSLLKRADQALYQAKKTGRNRAVVH